MEIRWKVKAIGNSAGVVKMAGSRYVLPGDLQDAAAAEGQLSPDLEIEGKKGKLADSEDSFLFVYCEIDPRAQSIELSASFEVREGDACPNQQAGFGIMAADTAFSGDAGISGKQCRHRNHLLLGRFRTLEGRDHGYGLRAVGGYTDPCAAEYEPVRRLDPSRTFTMQESVDEIRPGDRCRLTLMKTDEGFTATLQKGSDQETLFFPGCDFLLEQDKEKIAVGFAAAGSLNLQISDIQVNLTPGKCSHTPEDAIRLQIPDYPFRRNDFDEKEAAAGWTGERKGGDLYVTPEGKAGQDGTADSPLDLYSAVKAAGAGTRIILADGMYQLDAPIYLPAFPGGRSGRRIIICAEHPGRAVLDGSGMGMRMPLVMVRGDYWALEGLVFQNSPLSGLFICGSGNLVKNCEACRNGDTGILICAWPGDARENWPAFNRVEDCDSFDNCDPALSNADGFGAKLSVGKGNEFYRCIAHHNIDDGFDLYNKSILGPTEPVLLEQCIAYENGKTIGDRHVREGNTGGIGFKLGGENQAVRHLLWDCLAFLNVRSGYSANSNPSPELHRCSSLFNGRKDGGDNFVFCCFEKRQKHAWLLEDLYPPVSEDGKEIKRRQLFGVPAREPGNEDRPKRRADGSIMLPPHLQKIIRRRGAGALIGQDGRKNILMVIASLGGGGAERVTSILASEFSHRHNVYLLYLFKKEQCYPVSSDVHLIDGSVGSETLLRRLFHLPWQFPYLMWNILRAKQKYHIDTTVSMLHRPNLYNGLLPWRDRRVMSERNDPSRKPAREFEDAKRSYRRADHVVFQSERVKNLFEEKVRAKSTIIRNPISVTCFADPVPEKKIVTVGRYTQQKNHDMLIRAFARFAGDHPGYTLHLYGEGELDGKLRALIDELGLAEKVFLEGFKDDIHQYIRDAKMFVLSSDYEGMSNALMEAMMMGLPCISTACTGSDELLTDGQTGLLVPVGDEQAFAGAMGRLADDDALCGKLARNAQMLSLSFEKEYVVRAWERILFR